jgi:hypothetical protein
MAIGLGPRRAHPQILAARRNRKTKSLGRPFHGAGKQVKTALLGPCEPAASIQAADRHERRRLIKEKNMKAILLEQPGKFEQIEISEPERPAAGEALVRVHRVGI